MINFELTPYQKGFDAFYENSFAINPYSDIWTPEKYEEWKRGYNDAYNTYYAHCRLLG